jgi:hypothetical protein
MHYVFSFGLALALGLALMAGCSDENGEGGSGGTAGTGGTGGSDLCAGVTCEDNECRSGGTCRPADGTCDYETVAENGTACSEGECLDGVCAPVGAFPCTEQGIRDAAAEGGGPHFFACDGPTTIVLAEDVPVDKSVILDGGGNLTLTSERPSGLGAPLFGVVGDEASFELRGFKLSNPSSVCIAGYSAGELKVLDSDFEDCRTGIISSGALGVENSTFSSCQTGIEGTAKIVDSTFEDNEFPLSTPGASFTLEGSTVVGGSIVCGFACEGTALTIVNSTLDIGGIAYFADITMINSTFEQRDPTVWAWNSLTTLIVANSIVVGACSEGGTILSNGYNIESPGNTCGFDEAKGDLFDVSADDLKLGPLTDNGGPTMTHALGTDSVAIDKISEADCVDADGAPLTTDQRGEPRPGGTMCDVGAFELQP